MIITFILFIVGFLSGFYIGKVMSQHRSLHDEIDMFINTKQKYCNHSYKLKQIMEVDGFLKRKVCTKCGKHQ